MYAYRPEDVFRVNDDLRYTVHSLPGDAGRYVVVDDFYADPEAVRKLVLSTPYPIWSGDRSPGNFVDYQDCRQTISVPFPEPQAALTTIAAEALRIEIRSHRDFFVTNLFRQLADPPAGGQPLPHDDGVSVAAVVMLNTARECAGGTAFYFCREPAVTSMPIDPAQYQAFRPRIYAGARSETDRSFYLPDWERWWERAALVEMRFNRVLLYPGTLFHGHWQTPGSFRDHWRVNQTLFFDDVAFHPWYTSASRSW